MTELITTLAGLIASLGNVQSVGVVKEHVALLQTKLNLLKEEFKKLEEENAKLKSQVVELENKILSSLNNEEFLEKNGAFFKRRPDGGYHDAVYCPKCHISTSPFPPGDHGNFACPSCGWFSSFSAGELKTVMPK